MSNGQPAPENYHIGSGALSINGSDIGGTTENGLTVSIENDIYLHKSGKFGSTPVKASLIGRKITLEVEMGETTQANLVNAIGGSVLEGGKVKFGGVAGAEIAGVPLVLTPFDGTSPWYFRNAVQTGSVEVAYQPDKPRVYKVTFTAMVDPDAADVDNLAYFS